MSNIYDAEYLLVYMNHILGLFFIFHLYGLWDWGSLDIQYKSAEEVKELQRKG